MEALLRKVLEEKLAPHDDDEYGGMELAQKITGYKPSWIRQLAAEGELPCLNPAGSQYRFSKQDLEEWMKGRKRKTSKQREEEVRNKYATLNRTNR